jgi:P27 family predicted phage terminase small subunit
MKGRKPKPVAFRVIEGNREHRPLNAKEPKPKSEAPPRPRFLKGEELKVWKYVTGELLKMGTLASSDQGDIVSYCHWWGSLAKAKTKLLSSEGNDPEVIKTTSGNYIQNPWLGIANTAAKELTKVCEKLGLDPTSRTRIKLDKPEPQSRRERLLG